MNDDVTDQVRETLENQTTPDIVFYFDKDPESELYEVKYRNDLKFSSYCVALVELLMKVVEEHGYTLMASCHEDDEEDES